MIGAVMRAAIVDEPNRKSIKPKYHPIKGGFE